MRTPYRAMYRRLDLLLLNTSTEFHATAAFRATWDAVLSFHGWTRAEYDEVTGQTPSHQEGLPG